VHVHLTKGGKDVVMWYFITVCLILYICGIIHCVSKNVSPLICYNLDVHDPITVIFGRSVTEKVGNKTMFCFPTPPV